MATGTHSLRALHALLVLLALQSHQQARGYRIKMDAGLLGKHAGLLGKHAGLLESEGVIADPAEYYLRRQERDDGTGKMSTTYQSSSPVGDDDTTTLPTVDDAGSVTPSVEETEVSTRKMSISYQSSSPVDDDDTAPLPTVDDRGRVTPSVEATKLSTRKLSTSYQSSSPVDDDGTPTLSTVDDAESWDYSDLWPVVSTTTPTQKGPQGVSTMATSPTTGFPPRIDRFCMPLNETLFCNVKNLKLLCAASGIPVPVVTISVNGNVSSSSNLHSVTHREIVRNTSDRNFTCSASNFYGTVTKTCSIRFKIGRTPKLAIGDHKQTINVLKNIKHYLNCSLAFDPLLPTTVTWFRGRLEKTEWQNFSIVEVTTSADIHMVPFKCTVNNDCGHEARTFIFNVEESESSGNDEQSRSIQQGAVVGIAVGCVIVGCVVGVLGAVFAARWLQRRKQAKNHNHTSESTEERMTDSDAYQLTVRMPPQATYDTVLGEDQQQTSMNFTSSPGYSTIAYS